MSIASLSETAKAIPSAIERAKSNPLTTLLSLSSGKKATKVSDDIAALTVAIGLQSQTAGLRAASQNVAQATSLLQVASDGLDSIQENFDKLTELTIQAGNGALTATQRASLQSQADDLVKEINRIAQNTSFGGTQLLDGALKASGNEVKVGDDSLNLGLDDFRSDALFTGKIDLSSVDAAKASVDVLAPAGIKIATGRANVGSLQARFDITSAALESAVQNQEAARSVLTDTDFAEASTLNILNTIQSQSGVALLAQSNKLKTGVLDLLNS